MPGVITLIKKNYIVFFVITAITVFFAIYNVYIVDQSLINLRLSLLTATEGGDFQKIKSFLKIPILKEISKISMSAKDLIYMEMSLNMAGSVVTPEQLDELKFYLKNTIFAKEKERGRALSILDGLNSRFFGTKVELSAQQLEAKAKKLLALISSRREKTLLQRLYYELGNVYLQLGDIPKSVDAFLQSAQLGPASQIAIKSRFNLAWAYKMAEDYAKSIASFEDLIQAYPKSDLAILSHYQLADIFFRQGEYKKAVEKYAQVADLYPEFEATALAWFQAGYIAFYRLNDKELALKFFSNLEEKYYKTEISKHSVSLTRINMAEGYREKGFRLLHEKKYLEAIENFEKALEIAPSDAKSISGISLGFYWLGDKEGAVEKSKRASELAPLDEQVVINAMFVCINSPNLDGTIKIGEDFLSLNPGMERSEFYYNFAYAHLLKAQTVIATKHFDHTIRINPYFAYAYNNAGCALWAEGRYSEAIDRFKRAIDTKPDYADALFNLGIVYLYLNRPEEAHKEFESTLIINPEYADAKRYIAITDKLLKEENPQPFILK